MRILNFLKWFRRTEPAHKLLSDQNQQVYRLRAFCASHQATELRKSMIEQLQGVDLNALRITVAPGTAPEQVCLTVYLGCTTAQQAQTQEVIVAISQLPAVSRVQWARQQLPAKVANSTFLMMQRRAA